LGALAKVAESGAALVVKPTASNAARKFQDSTEIRFSNKEFTELQQGSTLVQAVRLVLDAMCGNRQINGLTAPSADSQTFCVAASALQYGPTGASLATGMFRNATKLGIPADGRFVNAVLRCFGDDIDAALAAWKDEIRPKCVAFEKRARSTPLPIGRPTGKNLVASYCGLLYVCGRALRPDIALRLVYAMSKEGLEPNENALNSYRSGRRVPKPESEGGFRSSLEQKLKLIDPYESLLFVECTKYDRNDRRRAGDKRVRIIL
jgi:pentatricopeptide repeat protein